MKEGFLFDRVKLCTVLGKALHACYSDLSTIHKVLDVSHENQRKVVKLNFSFRNPERSYQKRLNLAEELLHFAADAHSTKNGALATLILGKDKV